MRNKFHISIILFTTFALCAAKGWHTPAPFKYEALDYFTSGVIELYLDNNLQSALQYMTTAETYHSAEPEIKKALAEIYYDLGNFDLSLQKSKEGLLLAPTDRELLRIAAMSFAAAGNDGNSAPLYKKANIVNELDYLPLLRCYLSKNKITEAANLCEYIKKQFPGSAIPYLLEGDVYSNAGMYKKAIPNLEKAITIDPSVGLPYLMLSNSYYKTGNHRASSVALGLYVAHFQQDTVRIIDYVKLLLKTDQNRKARDELVRYATKNKRSVRYLYESYASLAFSMEKFEEALFAFGYLRDSVDTASPDYYYDVGRCYLGLLCPESTAIVYRRGLQKAPRIYFWTDLALIYAYQKEPDSVFAVLKEAARSFADSSKLYYWGGMSFKQLGKYELASDYFVEALRRTPSDELSTFQLADTKEKMGLRAESIVLLEDLLQSFPDKPLYQNYLGYILVDESIKIEYGKELIEKALHTEPQNPAYLDSYGWAYFRIGDYKNAEIYLLKAEKTYKSDPEMYIHLAQLYLALGKSALARKHIDRALELDPENKKSIYLFKIIYGDKHNKN
jgi:tetratricopeptide (TPR) repeat protein